MTTNEAPDTITVELPIRPMLNAVAKQLRAIIAATGEGESNG